jgi:serine/threonine-protein kinase
LPLSRAWYDDAVDEPRSPIAPDNSWIPAPGTLIGGGRYRVERVIGGGGMGAVVAAEHVGLGDRVAVKFLHPRLLTDVQLIERFVREARVTARVKNEHVVRVLDVGTTEKGLPFLAMELLEGEDLGKMAARAPLPLELAIDCILQASVGLLAAHAAGIVHRDVKPSNLWLTRRTDGSPLVKVLDFGISKVVESNSENEKRLTDTRSTFGSPSYMAPEQVRSAKHVDARADAWALGVVLYEILTRRLPFDADTVSGVLAAIVADPPAPLRTLRPDAPPEVEAAIIALLEKAVDKRASLVETAARLRPFASAAGQATADLIARSYGAGAPSNLTISGSEIPSAPVSSPTAMGDTLPLLATTRTYGGKSEGGGKLRLVAGAVLLLAVGLGAGVFATSRATKRGTAAPPTPAEMQTIAATPIASPPTVGQPPLPAPLPAAASPAPVASAVASVVVPNGALRPPPIAKTPRVNVASPPSPPPSAPPIAIAPPPVAPPPPPASPPPPVTAASPMTNDRN